jgi:hypothetical protein
MDCFALFRCIIIVVSLVYTDIRVNNLFRKYAGTKVINLFNQKQVTIYTNKIVGLKLNLALLSAQLLPQMWQQCYMY